MATDNRRKEAANQAVMKDWVSTRRYDVLSYVEAVNHVVLSGVGDSWHFVRWKLERPIYHR
jgi:hypothetical protein